MELDLHTNRGAIHCAANLSGGAHTVKNGHGDIHLRRVAGATTLSTGAGRIEVHDSHGHHLHRPGRRFVSWHGMHTELVLRRRAGAR